MTKTYTEQISSFEATRQAKAADRNAIMQKAAEDGATLSAEQKTQYDALDAEIKEIAEHLTRLRALEVETKAAAVPVAGTDPAAAAASRVGVIQVKDQTPPGIGFARAVMCKMQAFQEYRERRGDRERTLSARPARSISSSRPRCRRRRRRMRPTWARSSIRSNLAGEFLEFLRPMTIVDRIPNLRRVPPNVRIIGQTTGGTGYWVGQGAAKPVTRFGVAPTTLGFAKVAAISVLTEELARFSSPSAEALVRDQLAACPRRAARHRLHRSGEGRGRGRLAGVDHERDHRDHGDGGCADGSRGALVGVPRRQPEPGGCGVHHAEQRRARARAAGECERRARAFPGISMNGGTLLGIPVVASQYAATIGTGDSAVVILANARADSPGRRRVGPGRRQPRSLAADGRRADEQQRDAHGDLARVDVPDQQHRAARGAVHQLGAARARKRSPGSTPSGTTPTSRLSDGTRTARTPRTPTKAKE